MSESAIRAEIKNILSNVADVGKVYDYERWSADWNNFINLFKITISSIDQVRGWEIGRKAVKEEKTIIGPVSGGNERVHTFFIKGYMSVKDATATEKTFNALIESIASAFRSNLRLNNSAQSHDYVQCEIIETRMFGGVHCHYAELTLIVTELI